MSDSGALGLNEHHQDELVQLLRFCRYQRGLRLRSVEACFTDAEKSRLNDNTYTRDEVLDLLNGLKDVLTAELESELINTAHMSLLLLRQVCYQAEKWHLKLYVDLSDLENRELLDAVQSFEDQQFNMTAQKRPSITVLKKLEPLEGAGAAPLLKAEIDRLNAENAMLKERVTTVQGTATDIVEQKSLLQFQLEQAQSKLTEAEQQQQHGVPDPNMGQLESKLAQLKSKMDQEAQSSLHSQQQLEEELTGAHKRLLEVQAQLQMTETELEKKFSKTGAYKNMKQMLNKKNQQIKEMRAKLNQYEPSAQQPEEDD